jgi:hypothetical protein
MFTGDSVVRFAMPSLAKGRNWLNTRNSLKSLVGAIGTEPVTLPCQATVGGGDAARLALLTRH